MEFTRTLGLALALTAISAFGEILTGVITDIDDDRPLADVKISLGPDRAVLSGADGTFSLEAGGVGIRAHRPTPGIIWDGRAGLFRWDESHGAAAVEVRDIRGNLIGGSSGKLRAGARAYRYGKGAGGIRFVTLETGRGRFRYRMTGIGGMILAAEAGSAGAAAKAGRLHARTSAIHTLSFEKEGYATVTRGAEAGSAVDVKLKKTSGARLAMLSWYESYPDPGSEECIKYNGCTWAGQFAALSGQQPKSWVEQTNIAAVHQKDFAKYKLKTLRLRQTWQQIDVVVYDMCADSDCDGCCTRNAGGAGFLIDIEKHTKERFQSGSGQVEWLCLDCKD